MNTIEKDDFEFNAGIWPLSPDKPTIIFFHGASLSKSFWNFQVEGLIDTANTIAVDLPGHGGTTLPSRDNIKDFAKDIINLIDSLKINKPLIVSGMSMGGAIAQQLLIDYPDYFHAGILMNTGARLKVLPMIFDMVKSDYQAYMRDTAKFSISPKSNLEKIQTLAANFTGKCSAETTINDFHACNSFDIMEKINTIKSKTLVIGATEDLSTPLKYGKWLFENIENSEFVEIENAGHFAALEKHEEVNKAIKSFINNLT